MTNLWNNLTWQQLGLAAFVLTAQGMNLVLLYDYFLYLSGREMITTFCRANPWLAWLILTVIQFGVMGLAVHLMAIVKIDQDKR